MDDDDEGSGIGVAAAAAAGAAALGGAALLGRDGDDDVDMPDADLTVGAVDMPDADLTVGAADLPDADLTIGDDDGGIGLGGVAAGAAAVGGAAAAAGIAGRRRGADVGAGAAAATGAAAGAVGTAAAASGGGGTRDRDGDKAGGFGWGWLKWLLPLLLLLLLLGLLLAFCGGDDDDVAGPIAAVPTATAVPPTAVPEPTATAVPEPTATAVPEPTATPEPEPTATPEPEPTATPEPAPACAALPSVLEDNGFNTLLTAVGAAGVGDALTSSGALTVFAPTDDAFAAVPSDITAALLADTDLLTQVLQYHAVEDAVLSGDFAPGAVPTFMGSALAIRTDLDGPRVNASRVTVADLEAGDCVVHGVDGVLVPPALLATLGVPTLNAAVAGGAITFVDGTADFTDADRNTLDAICALVSGESDLAGLPAVQWQRSGDTSVDEARASAIAEVLAGCGADGLPIDALSPRPAFTG